MAVKKYVTDASMYVWSLLRISLGFIFLWAFLDKLFGLGLSTCKDKVSGLVDVGCSQSWLHGGSPTKGFLGHAVTGPFSSFYHNLAGQAWVDWLFMGGLVMAGVGLSLGLWVRFASLAGILMVLLIWSALLWPANAPGIDEHIIYALVLFGVALTYQDQPWSLNSWWAKTPIAKALPFLK